MIERFTVAQFEAALPSDATKIGMHMGEWCWAILVHPHIRIAIRSSIDSSGVAASCGEDSIRLILEVNDGCCWSAMGKGVDAYTQRTRGWDQRLLGKIAELRERAERMKRRPPAGWFVGYVKKNGANHGRPFASTDNNFTWLD